MTLKENAIVLAGLVVAVAGLVLYGKGRLADLLPAAVADGFEASTVLGAEFVDGILHPLNAFGIAPGTFPDKTKKYELTVPWLSNDSVSNNDSGINFNYF